jgi:hypothetical protein
MTNTRVNIVFRRKNSRKRDGNFLQQDNGAFLVYKRQLDPFSK